MIDISVIIPTRNRSRYLDTFFQSLTEQSLSMDKYEVIVIDNGSIDGTKEVCKKWENVIKNFKYIYDDNPGLHIGRNIGYMQSSSDLLVYADDDIIAMPSWLEAILNGFEKYKDVALIGGNVFPQFEECPPVWIEELYYDDAQYGAKILSDYSCIIFGENEKEISPFYVYGCNFAIRKWVLDKTHGFHPDGMPDELLYYRGDGETYVSEYVKQAEMKAFFIPDASVYHHVSKQRMDLNYISKIAYRNGISNAYMFLRKNKITRLKVEILKKRLGLWKRRRWKYINVIKRKEEIRGEEYLLANYRKCKNVEEWVHRQDYLGVNGIIPSTEGIY